MHNFVPLDAYAEDNAPRQMRHAKEQAGRVNQTATRYSPASRMMARSRTGHRAGLYGFVAIGLATS